MNPLITILENIGYLATQEGRNFIQVEDLEQSNRIHFFVKPFPVCIKQTGFCLNGKFGR